MLLMVVAFFYVRKKNGLFVLFILLCPLARFIVVGEVIAVKYFFITFSYSK